MNTGAAPKIIEEFDISLEDGSASTVVPPGPPAAPRLILLVPREYTWRVDIDGYKPGTAIEFFLKGGLRRMLTSGAAASELARELGLHPTQLFRWRQQLSHTAAAMPKQELDEKAARRPQDWSPEEKLEAVMKSQGLTETELGAFLRSRGLHKAVLDEWRESVCRGARAELAGNTGGSKSREQKRIRELERELGRKDKALAEASALLVLKKKAAAIWGDGDDDTELTSER